MPMSYAMLIVRCVMQAQVLAKHISDYNIKAIKFSPYEEGRLMTCGKDSVRMFRLKVNTFEPGHSATVLTHVTHSTCMVIGRTPPRLTVPQRNLFVEY